MVFTVLAVRRNSPSRGRPPTSSRAMVCERSPLATAPMTRAISLVGCTRSLMSMFTEAISAAHDPLLSPMTARSVMRPSLPTARLSRSSSLAKRSFSSTTSLKVSAILPSSPSRSMGSRTLKSPFFRATSATRSCPRSSCGTAGDAWLTAALPFFADPSAAGFFSPLRVAFFPASPRGFAPTRAPLTVLAGFMAGLHRPAYGLTGDPTVSGHAMVPRQGASRL